MLLDDAVALSKALEGLINRCISDDAEALTALAKAKEVIEFDYEIICDAEFRPFAETLYSTAHFESIDEFKNAREQESGNSTEYDGEYGISWDDDPDYGEYILDKRDARVEVEIKGLAAGASKEAQELDAKNKRIALEKQWIEEQEMLVEKLRKQLKEAEAYLEELR